MKKILLTLLSLLIIFNLSACNKAEESKIERNIGKSEKFSTEEIDKAMVLVEQNFEFKDAEITKIYYDEEKSNGEIEMYKKYGTGSMNDITPDNIIVINTDFTVSSDINEGLSEGEYKAFNWILIREDKNSDWKVEEKGY